MSNIFVVSYWLARAFVSVYIPPKCSLCIKCVFCVFFWCVDQASRRRCHWRTLKTINVLKRWFLMERSLSFFDTYTLTPKRPNRIKFQSKLSEFYVAYADVYSSELVRTSLRSQCFWFWNSVAVDNTPKGIKTHFITCNHPIQFTDKTFSLHYIT